MARAASALYLGKAPARLTSAEAAALSLLPQSPTHRGPKFGTAQPARDIGSARKLRGPRCVGSGQRYHLAAAIATECRDENSPPIIASDDANTNHDRTSAGRIVGPALKSSEARYRWQPFSVTYHVASPAPRVVHGGRSAFANAAVRI